ncbi:uncharacterized protein [Anoplolepis gracilipes]
MVQQRLADQDVVALRNRVIVLRKSNFCRGEKKMDTGNQENQENQGNLSNSELAKILQTCLTMEIGEAKKKIDGNMKEIKQYKSAIRAEINKRKQFKKRVAQMEKLNVTLNETLRTLNMNVRENSEALEMMKANIDPQSKLNQIEAQEYEKLIADYEETWHSYRAQYEELPLAKTRNAVKINLQKLQIEYMVMEYKKAELAKIIKQREHIDWIRMRSKIIEFATVMVEQSKVEKHLMKLKENVRNCEKELQSTEMELQMLRKKEEDKKELRKQEVLAMGPPKINPILYQETCSSNQMRPKHQWMRQTFDDNISVNTSILEELCIDENIKESPEIIDVEAIHDNDFESTTVQKQKTCFNLKATNVIEKNETSTAPVTPDVEMSKNEENIDNDVNLERDDDINMKEIHQEKTQKLRESIKTQASCSTNKNLFKHSATNMPDEIQAKRIRLQEENSKDSSNIIITPQPLSIVKETNSKSSSVPKIINIESVHYNIEPISKHVQQPNIFSSSMFSPMYLECCNSISSFDLLSKAPSSLYEGSLCNYNFNLSPTSDISMPTIDAHKDIPSSSKYTLQQNKNQSDEKKSSFSLNNFAKPTKDNFTLF